MDASTHIDIQVALLFLTLSVTEVMASIFRKYVV